jgi:hypothetical protein
MIRSSSCPPWQLDNTAGPTGHHDGPVSSYINLNAGAAWDQMQDRAFFLWGAGVDWIPVERIMLTAEIFGTGRSDPRVQTGIRLTPKEWFDVDLIYGRNITGERANWITLGLTVRFEPFAQPGGQSTAARLMKR